MSEKELLYIDDALGHLEKSNQILTTYMGDVEDEDLVNVINEILKKNSDLYKELYKLL